MIAFVVRHVACTACGEAYAEDNVSVVLHNDQQLVLEARCEACQAHRSSRRMIGPYEQLRAEPLCLPL